MRNSAHLASWIPAARFWELLFLFELWDPVFKCGPRNPSIGGPVSPNSLRIDWPVIACLYALLRPFLHPRRPDDLAILPPVPHFTPSTFGFLFPCSQSSRRAFCSPTAHLPHYVGEAEACRPRRGPPAGRMVRFGTGHGSARRIYLTIFGTAAFYNDSKRALNPKK